MKLTVTTTLSHPLLGMGSLLAALPLALDSVERAASAGVAATGPLGMDVQPRGQSELVRVHFTMVFEESGPRLPDEAPAAAPEA